jgi:aminoglycoside phosphotransferase (APT) family kinase protein
VTLEQTIDVWIREHLGARVISITRQARWRAAWLVDAERDGIPLSLVVRGERGADIPMQFPLHHEMSLQKTLAEQGIPVPIVYGWIDELPAYVMGRVEGQPGFDGLSIEQRDTVMREYMATVARLHRLPLQPFIDAGVERAATPASSGCYGTDRFENVWRAGKSALNPLGRRAGCPGHPVTEALTGSELRRGRARAA